MAPTNSQILKSSWRWFNNKYLVQTILWVLFNIVLIAAAILWESNNKIINELFTMSFFQNNISPETITTLKTYLYIAILASCIATGALVLIQIKIWFKKYIEAKYDVLSNFDNNYFIFKSVLALDMSKNITYIFCFTNIFTTFLILIYWLLYFSIYVILDRIFKMDHKNIGSPWWKDSQKQSVFTILTVELVYLTLKNLLLNFAQLDIDQVLKYFIPSSSLALILAVFIQSLVKNNVKTILNNINNVRTKVDNFKIFYNWDYQKTLDSYLFTKEAPIIIRNYLKNDLVNPIRKQEVLDLLTEIYEFILFIQKQNIKTREVQYIYYHLFYEIETKEEIQQIKNHILKIRKHNKN